MKPGKESLLNDPWGGGSARWVSVLPVNIAMIIISHVH